MKLRAHYLMAPVLLGLLTTSCDKKELDEVSPVTTAETVSEAAASNYIFQETFEGSSAFSGRHTQFGTSYSFQMATNPVFAGAKSGRFELRSSDGQVANGTRAEVIVADPATNKNRWYSFAAYFPAKDYAYDSGSEVISQWWQTSGSTQATSLRVRKDRLILRTGNDPNSLKEIDLGAVTKDSWQEYVFHFIHSNGSDGLIEVWRNGNKILERKGGNMYNDKMPNWKIGVYKASWNSGSTETSKRVLYYDNIRVGNENATLASMTGSTSTPSAPAPAPDPTPTPTPTPEPTPAPAPSEPTEQPASSSDIASITLVDAGTEKDVMKLNSDNNTLSFSALGTKKLNFRADLKSGVGSVKFELSGAMNRTYTDNAAPHAMFGDNGKGNYYYGNLTMPEGNYTLTATPYSGAKGTGTAGTPVTVKFTVKVR
ncbi:polysaccharide lyase [uncultured Pontibacter sp.]|uniref:polysaccharide lyase n=1 Tax=uncultured Pontibacter sp. TaxID=453356 RepID=UPI002611E9F4|nr:polysaccharide lyase [uncultured Pontibacter sp.]